MTDPRKKNPPPWLALRYWWLPVTIIVMLLMVAAYLLPYQPVELSDLTPEIRDATTRLDASFGKPVDQSFQYATRRSFSSSNGPMEVEIRATLRPLGNGLLERQDDWYDTRGHGIVYQERYVLFRNLFSVNTRTRETAPVVHDMMGRVGWFSDVAQAMTSTLEGGTPESPGWKMSVVLDRVSDTDGQGLVLKTTPYQRRVDCERTGEIDGAQVGIGLSGSYPRVSCRIMTSDQPVERRSEYVYLPQPGIFLLLNYRQQGQREDATLDVKGSYLSFKTLPAP
jgi:hypothetical protein